MRAICTLLSGLTLLALAACGPGEPELSAEDVAAHMGLVDGRTLHYEVTLGSASSEDHSYQRSLSYAGRVVFSRNETNNNFQRVDSDGIGAVTDLEATLDGLQMLARGDCLPRCGDYDPPVQMLPYPLATGSRIETSSTLTIREGDTSSTVEERHVFTVGSLGTVSTPAGQQEAYEIGWQRFVDGGDLQAATLYLVPELGLVGIDRFDGTSLRLSGQDG